MSIVFSSEWLNFLIVAVAAILLIGAFSWHHLRSNQGARRLKAALRDKDPVVRKAAIEVISERGIGDYAEDLRGMIDTETDPTVLNALAEAVSRNQWEPADNQKMVELRLWATSRPESAASSGPVVPITATQTARFAEAQPQLEGSTPGVSAFPIPNTSVTVPVIEDVPLPPPPPPAAAAVAAAAAAVSSGLLPPPPPPPVDVVTNADQGEGETQSDDLSSAKGNDVPVVVSAASSEIDDDTEPDTTMVEEETLAMSDPGVDPAAGAVAAPSFARSSVLDGEAYEALLADVRAECDRLLEAAESQSREIMRQAEVEREQVIAATFRECENMVETIQRGQEELLANARRAVEQWLERAQRRLATGDFAATGLVVPPSAPAAPTPARAPEPTISTVAEVAPADEPVSEAPMAAVANAEHWDDEDATQRVVAEQLTTAPTEFETVAVSRPAPARALVTNGNGNGNGGGKVALAQLGYEDFDFDELLAMSTDTMDPPATFTPQTPPAVVEPPRDESPAGSLDSHDFDAFFGDAPSSAATEVEANPVAPADDLWADDALEPPTSPPVDPLVSEAWDEALPEAPASFEPSDSSAVDSTHFGDPESDEEVLGIEVDATESVDALDAQPEPDAGLDTLESDEPEANGEAGSPVLAVVPDLFETSNDSLAGVDLSDDDEDDEDDDDDEEEDRIVVIVKTKSKKKKDKKKKKK